MPIPAAPLQRGDRGPAVTALHRTFEHLDRQIDPAERARRSFGASTEALLRDYQGQAALTPTGVFDEATRAAVAAQLSDIGPFAVYGTLTDAAGDPVAGATIFAVDVDLRRNEVLGQTTSDLFGEFEVRHTASKFTRAEKDTADLVVRAVLGDERLAESAVWFNAPPEARVDLASRGRLGPAEIERLDADLAPLLDGIETRDLTEEDVPFLAGETRRDPELWRAYVLAHRLAAEVKGVPATAIYGWLRGGIRGDWDGIRRTRVGVLRSSLLDAIAKNIIPAGIADRIDAILAVLGNPEHAELEELLGTAVPEEVKRKVLGSLDALDAVSNDALSRLVESRTLEPPEADLLGLTVSLHRLAGRDASVVSTILGTDFESVPTGRLRSTRDLVALDPEDWERALEAAGAPVPDGVSRPDHARSLAMQVAAAAPEEAFRRRVTQVSPVLETAASRFHVLARSNENALARDFDALDLSRVPEGEHAPLREAHATLRDLANDHPGLGLHEVFARHGATEAVGIAAERVGWVEGVLANNPDVSFVALDYLPDSTGLAAVDFGELTPEARQLVVANFQGHQRTFAVTGNAIPAQELRRKGFGAASPIAALSLAEFTERSGLPAAEAAAYHATAVEITNVAAINWFGIYEALRDGRTTPVRVIPSPEQFFRSFAGYAQLTADQPWCECESCQSVLSPAAYFVDLMYFIERHILSASFKGREDHPLHLEKRRPDLWDLELTCANTTDWVPTLDLVNAILERYLKDIVPFADAPAIYRHLAEQERSFTQPFTLPLERLAILLEHFRLSRYDIARAMRAGADVLARTRLGLSLKAYELVTAERYADPAFLLQLFRIESNVTTPDGVIKPVEMSTLVRAMGMPHDTVEAIVRSAFVGTDGSAVPAIDVVFSKLDPINDVQYTSEAVHNLTLRRLDRIHRFARLWRTLPWTVGELDHVLKRLSPPGSVASIAGGTAAAPATLERIADLLEANATWSLPVDDLMALSDEFPAASLRGEEESLFDRLFNQAPFVDLDGAWDAATAGRFTHPAWTGRLVAGQPPAPVGRPIPADNTLARLLAGLQITDGEFVELVAGLATLPALDRRAASAAEDESIELSRDSIGALYRHARLRALLGVSVADFLQLLALARGFVTDLDDVRRVVELAAWQKTSGFTLAQITSLIAAPVVDAAARSLAGEIVDGVRAEHSLELADTLFTQLGLSETDSKRFLAANLTRAANDTRPFEPYLGGYRVRAIGLAGLVNLPGPAPQLDLNAVRRLLGDLSPFHVLDVALGTALGRSPDEVAALRRIADPLSSADAVAIARAIHHDAGSPTLAADTDRLETSVARMRRFDLLFAGPAFDLDGLDFAASEPAVFFGAGATAPITAPPAITLDVIRNVAAYATLATATDAGFTTASGPADRDAIQRVLVDVAAASDADLASVLRTDAARIGALRPHLALPAGPFDAIAILARCLAIAEDLAVSGETLRRMVEESTPAATFDALAQAAEDVYGAFRSKYPDATTFAEKLEPFEDRLRGRKRDGLVDYITTRWPKPFADGNKLYEFFLIDVLVGGCARTSRVVAATTSLQLYLRRVLMNLEQSASWNLGGADPVGYHATFADSQRRRECKWRQYYRTWEAARRVFLYPENYLEPELRDDKTELFEELEDTLLQTEIDRASVHDAFSRYLTGFEEIARLEIAGAHHDAAAHTLHLFGVTRDDAPVYYYRSVDESEPAPARPRFSAWQKIALQIPVRKVSPVVFAGRLYVFWVETTTRSMNKFADNKSVFGGYRHTLRIKYSTLRLDGAWSSPQVVTFIDKGGTAQSRIVEDPIDDVKKRRLERDRDEKQNELDSTDRQTRLGNAKQAVVDAQGVLEIETAHRIGAKQRLDRFPDAGEAAAIAAAGLFGGPAAASHVFGILVAIRVGDYERTKGEEAGALQTVQLLTAIRDSLIEAEGKLKAERDRLQNEIDHLKVYVRWDPTMRDHSDALDSYRPDGWEWDRVYPEVVGTSLRITIAPRNTPRPDTIDEAQVKAYFDVYPRPLELTASEFEAYPGTIRDRPLSDQPTRAADRRLNWVDGRIQLMDIASADNAIYPGQQLYASTYWLNLPNKVGATVAYAPPTSEIQIVSGAPDSMIVEWKGDSVWMRKDSAGTYTGLRLSTGVVDKLAEKFVLGGADELLKASFQDTLEEERSKVSPIASQAEADSANPFHPSNACLGYQRETFLHIPFLVANHHNSQDDFADAQRWYHHLFDPTAEEGDPWRYREFRTPGPTTTLRKLLTDDAALRAYRKDPFSPHAIARTRMSAYQKAIVMKYVDNLLDWGDMLFNQFTMESVNEALMLYVMAQDILGPRPVVLGSCGEGKVKPRTYRTIHAGLSNVSDLLIELEPPPKVVTRPPGTPLYVVASHEEPMTLQQTSRMEVRSFMMTAGPGAPVPPGDPGAAGGQPEGGQFVATGPVATPSVVRDLKAGGATYWTGTSGTALKTLRQGNGVNGNGNGDGNGFGAVGFGTVAPPIDFVEPGPDTIDVGIGVPGGKSIVPFGDLDLSRGLDIDIKYGLRDGQTPHGHRGVGKDHFTPFEIDPALMVPPKDPVFCIPPNGDLLAYWDRVEDRLFKIRNCMDISGVRRRLELFAPPIDPRLLVRMTAAGLSIDDVLNSTSGNLPPYRFAYLIDKAKQHAGTVQAFGAQLLSAFEKGDAEELAHLRAVHEQNLLQMRTRLAELEIRAADDTLEGLRRQKAAVEYRRQHFLSLHAVGQIPGERKQQELQGEASGFRTAAGIAQVVASILTIIPDTGSPFAMKFGGSQLGAAGRAVAEGLNAVAAYNEMAAARAGVEASNQRRAEEWKHQIETARLELSQIEKNITAAEIRRDIAKHSLAVHEQTVSQTEEMFEFFREKFSSVDRYRLLQKELRRLYRMSYNSTLALARMVEQAYRAERPGDDTLLTLDYWDGQSAGLLAGERLLLDLHRLERQFIERNYRELEVEHSFSLAQFAPEALDTLRLTGQCRFEIPEWFFDLTYPGQYRRRLKAVRLTIPCVTGPQVNVGATLRLDNSWIRQSVPPAAQELGDPPAVPLRHTVAIATSKAQNDAGVFEFSFRDERYMPFEGAGAISSWVLSLPRTLRVFDYSTISDVVMHLDYTAQHDAGLEERWDGVAQELLTLLSDAETPELKRSFSLRTDFPDAFHRLVSGPAATVVGFELESRHFPGFVAVRGRRLEVVTASLRVITPLRSLPATTLEIGRKTSGGQQMFKPVTAPSVPRVDGRELCEFDLGSVLKGPLDRGGVSGVVLGSYVMKLQTGVDRKSLHDIVFTLAYRLAVPPP